MGELRAVASAWWPLAASWLLMGLEMPAAAAVIARMPDPVTSLAALGGVVYPVSFVIEAPIIMLLSASNALCGDPASYRLVRRFMIAACALLTLVHLLVVATPVYGLVVDGLLGVPPEVSESARLGLWIMLPWTAAIGYRRFQQGVLVRFGRSRTVGLGTAVRLLAGAAVLLAGWSWGELPGIAVGAAGIAAGVTAEAVWAGLAVRPVLRGELAAAPPPAVPLDLRAFLAFYVPLLLTPVVSMLGAPLVSAALSRMPLAVSSLACWTAVSSFLFLLRSTGLAMSEVVVAQIGRPGAGRALRTFTLGLAGAVTAALALSLALPVARAWLAGVQALPAELALLAEGAMWAALPIPALSVLHNGLQGVLVHRRATRGVTEAVALYLAANALVLGLGVALGRWEGLVVGLVAMGTGQAAQAGWLAWRVRGGRSRARAAIPAHR